MRPMRVRIYQHIYRRVRKKGQFDRKKGFSKRLEMHFVAFRQVFFLLLCNIQFYEHFYYEF